MNVFKFYYLFFDGFDNCCLFKDLNQIWKESTVQRLLQLVDLPLLEDILSCTEKFEARNDIGESLANGNTIKDDTTG